LRVLALDIGGSSVKQAAVTLTDGALESVEALETRRLNSNQFDDLRDSVLTSVEEALLRHPDIRRVGISTTGSVDRNGVVLNAGHFDGYSRVSWSEILASATPAIEHVYVTNDGRASTWAEYTAASPRREGHAHFVVGTGVGGATVVHGQIVPGDSGFAGYLGHIKVDLAGTIACSCGGLGCVETVASGPAIARAAGVESFAAAIKAAQAGNLPAIEAFVQAGRWLGVAISNVANVLNPSTVTVGGGVILAASELGSDGTNPYLDAAFSNARELSHRRIAASTEFRPASHGNDGGVIGAALLAAA